MFRAKLFCDWRNVSPILSFGFSYSETAETWRNVRNLAKLPKLSETKIVTCMSFNWLLNMFHIQNPVVDYMQLAINF
jgi:hypothetical protein